MIHAVCRRGRPVAMSRALSLDLRTRVLKSVADGMSHRQACERFGVSAASVSRWRRRTEVQGDARPKALGGDRRSGRIEACKDLILGVLAETPDITIEELRRSLASHGHTFGFGTIQRFFERHRVGGRGSVQAHWFGSDAPRCRARSTI
ncbi:hypothetical protein CCR97_00255 [Rhodoplanes elegans]|uniref:Transposase n=1 Tax=Rhodoplanes elegans TaxID=29408 RepID=A0A327KA18_9BRAD|nr:hypothetical protein [Rhodoplanes elegans]RAI32148.1 hypothetical protein CH338_24670 [Rhodoplanes elegans]